MTLAQPYLYWQRRTSYGNDIYLPNTHVYNRNPASRDVQDQHVRTYLHTRVMMVTTLTTPPTVDWFGGMDFVQKAQWTPQQGSSIGAATEGDLAMMCYAPLVLVSHSLIGAPGRDVAVWATQKVESARVYHTAPPTNFDVPAVQSGLDIFDRFGVRDPGNGYLYTVTVRQTLETLWASSVPPT